MTYVTINGRHIDEEVLVNLCRAISDPEVADGRYDTTRETWNDRVRDLARTLGLGVALTGKSHAYDAVEIARLEVAAAERAYEDADVAYDAARVLSLDAWIAVHAYVRETSDAQYSDETYMDLQDAAAKADETKNELDDAFTLANENLRRARGRLAWMLARSSR